MKRVISILASCMTALLLKGAVMPENLDTFRESARLLVEGIANGDKAALADAAEGFGDITMSEFDDFILQESPAGSISAPFIAFTSDYCDEIRRNNFRLVAMETLDLLRYPDDEDGILTVTRSIGPEANASFTINGAGNMGMVIASASPRTLGITVECSGRDITVESDEEGYTYSAVWEMEKEAPFTISITNPGTESVSFAIALQ